MKTLKLIGMTILMVVLAVNFTACGNDDDDSSSGASKRITQIKSTRNSGNYTITINYKDNKLSKYVWVYDDDRNDYEINQSITYANDKVIIVGIIDGHDCEQTYTLNNKGYAASCSIPDVEGKKVEITFEYTETGYLSKAIEIVQRDTETITITYTFKYQNNNMIEARESYISRSIYMTYGNQTNKAGIRNYAIEEKFFYYQTAYYAGLLGKHCTSLPESYKEMGYNSHFIESGDFIYSADNDGYITQSTMSTSRGRYEVCTYSYE